MTFPFLETFLLSIFDVLQYYLMTNKVNNCKLKFEFSHIVPIVLCTLAAANSSFFIEGAYSYFASAAIFIMFIWKIYNKMGLKIIYLHIIGASLVLAIQIIVIFLVYAVIGKAEYSFSVGLVAQIIGLLLSFLAARYLPVHLLFRYVETRNDTFRIITMNIFVVLTLCVVYWYMNFEAVTDNLIFILVIAITILWINLVFLKEGLKNRAIEEQNHAYQLYLPIVNELMDEIRVKQHDFDNHMAALKAVLEQTKEAALSVERVESCINDIEHSFQHVNLLKMENKIVAGFLYSKMKQAVEEKIDFNIVIDDYAPVTSLRDYELLDLLSILIDNAFETGVVDSRVEIHLYKEKSKSIIEVSNKHPYISSLLVNDFFEKGFSSKGSEKRGIGLYKLKRMMLENKGEIEVYNADLGENYLVFKVSLPQ